MSFSSAVVALNRLLRPRRHKLILAIGECLSEASSDTFGDAPGLGAGVPDSPGAIAEGLLHVWFIVPR